MTIAEFSVETAELGGDAFVITVAGEADSYTVPELDRALHGVIALGGTAAALDLGDVTFIDSTALGVLLRHQTCFRARGGELVIVTQDRRVLRTLEITGFDRLFVIKRCLRRRRRSRLRLRRAARPGPLGLRSLEDRPVARNEAVGSRATTIGPSWANRARRPGRRASAGQPRQLNGNVKRIIASRTERSSSGSGGATNASVGASRRSKPSRTASQRSRYSARRRLAACTPSR